MSTSLIAPIYSSIKKLESLVTLDTTAQESLANLAREWFSFAARTEAEIDNWLSIPANANKLNMLASVPSVAIDFYNSTVAMDNVRLSTLARNATYEHATIVAKWACHASGVVNPALYDDIFSLYASNDLVRVYHAAKSNHVLLESTLAKSLFLVGQAVYNVPGTYLWTCPDGVVSVSIVAVGAGGSNEISGGSGGNKPGGTSAQNGGGGGGGGLGYSNNIFVTPGETYAFEVGSAELSSSDRDSFFISRTSDGGGAGGNGGYPGGGGGAGGYTGNGGTNSGGAGGGGGAGKYYAAHNIAAGGGVGLLGEGANGSYGITITSPGGGGSGGNDGSVFGGDYGGGGRYTGSHSKGGSGAVRIIWPGGVRQFPSTRTGDE